MANHHPTPEHMAKFLAGRWKDRPSEQRRFWALVSGVGSRGCWTFTGKVNNAGYGQFALDHAGKPRHVHVTLVLAHRYAFMLEGHEIPPDRYVDHTCRNRRCVRSDHLRLVDHRTSSVENNVGVWAQNAAKTHCKYGHPFTPENTALVQPKFRTNRHGNRKPVTRPGRVCLTCYPHSWRKAIVPRNPPPPGASVAAARMRAEVGAALKGRAAR